MRKISIAFDVDGTLISNKQSDKPVANERIRSLLITLSSFKNTKIIVWSGGGELYARQVGAVLGIDKYVDVYADKNHLGTDSGGKHIFEPGFKPDIAIDDIQACDLGTINLIVKEK